MNRMLKNVSQNSFFLFRTFRKGADDTVTSEMSNGNGGGGGGDNTCA